MPHCPRTSRIEQRYDISVNLTEKDGHYASCLMIHVRNMNLWRGMHLKVTASTTAVIPKPQHSVRISSEFLSHDHVTILPLASATLSEISHSAM